jgi:hypothetical protein
MEGAIIIFEMRFLRVFIDQSIMMAGHLNRVDPDLWRPLMFTFQEFYDLGPKVHPSTLRQIAESLSKTPNAGRLPSSPR